jgi:hypothetical protein
MGKTMKGVAAVLLVLCMLCACSYVETHYTRKDCVVVEVEQRLVTIVDKTGNEWCYYMDSEDYTDVPSVGTVVDVYMHTAHTDSYIYDDEIVDVRVVVQ